MDFASKYSSRVDERFTKGSFIDKITNKDYDFDGVSTLYVYSVDTPAINDYALTGTSRYGTAAELTTDVQTLTLTEDKSTTYTVDMKAIQDTGGAIAVQRSLKRFVDERMIPSIDTYGYARMVTAAVANGKVGVHAITTENAYSTFLGAQESLDNDLVPEMGRTLSARPAFINKLKLDPSFTLASDVAMKRNINGDYGDVDGVPVMKVPTSRLGANVEFILSHKSAALFIQKLMEHKVHDKPQGVSGWLVEVRYRYGVFVLDQKKDGIYVHANGAVS